MLKQYRLYVTLNVFQCLYVSMLLKASTLNIIVTLEWMQHTLCVNKKRKTKEKTYKILAVISMKKMKKMHKLFYNLLLLSFNSQILRKPLGHFDYG